MAKIDGESLFVREMKPDGRAKGAFLLLHGMESHSGWFVDCAARLVRNGWAVVAYDRAGWGKSPGPRGHMGSYRDLVETAAKFAGKIRKKYGSVHLAGMSWGGMAALYLALRREWLFDSVALIAPGIAAQRDFPLRDKALVAYDFLLGNNGTLVQPSFRVDHFTRDPQWQNFINNDPERVTRVTSAFCMETLKMRRFIKEQAGRRTLPPTLCLLAGDDAVIDNQTTSQVCRKAGALVEYIPRSAHTLIFEKPAQTAGILDHYATEARKASDKSGERRGSAWVVGAGAVGGAIASLLCFGGVETGVLAKTRHLDALEKNGLTLSSGNAARTTGTIAFADHPSRLPANPELVILAVKSFDTRAVLEQLRGHLPPTTCLLSLQNGVRNEDAIAKTFPQNTVIAAAVCAGLELTAPGAIRWADDRGGLAGALYKGDEALARSVWESTLPKTGMECCWLDVPDAAARIKWSKLMLNTGFNALNSMTGLPSAELLADPVFGALAVNAMREGFSVMQAMHLHPVDLPGFPVSKLFFLVRAPVGIARTIIAWQAKRSSEAPFSMRQDILKNRQNTEINELNGEIVVWGKNLGIATPANKKLVEMLENI